MSLDDIKPADLAMLRYVISLANYLSSDELDKLHLIDQAARQGSLGELAEDLKKIYKKIRAYK